MPCTKQDTRRYTNRNSPPYPGNECRVGQRMRGNDGQWYVVSSPNVNGVKRWVKVKEASGRKTAGRTTTGRAPRAPRTPTPRAPRTPRTRMTPTPRAPTSPRAPRTPRAPAHDWDNPLQNVPWRMYSRLDDKVLSTRVYLTKPTGKFFLYEVVDEQFVELTDNGDPDEFIGNRLDNEDAERLMERGFKVWVVSSSPVAYST